MAALLCEVIAIVSANLLKVITVYLKGQFTCQVMLLYELRRLTRVYHFLSTDTFIRSTLRHNKSLQMTSVHVHNCTIVPTKLMQSTFSHHLLILNAQMSKILSFVFSQTKQSYTDSEKKTKKH